MIRRQNQQRKIWFRQWSRKANAVFLSLGKVVHIASLRCEICDKAVGKAKINGKSQSIAVGTAEHRKEFSPGSLSGATLDDELQPNQLPMLRLILPTIQQNFSYPQAKLPWAVITIVLLLEVLPSEQDFLFSRNTFHHE